MKDIESLVQKINKEIQRIKDADFKSVTQYQFVQQRFAQIVVPMGRKHSGYIRSYENLVESVQRYNKNRKGRNKITPISKEEYEEQVTELYESFKTELNYESFMDSEREKMYSIIKDYFDYIGMDSELIKSGLDKLSTEELKQIFNKAKKASTRKQNDPNYNSDNFRTHLADELYSYLVTNDLI